MGFKIRYRGSPAPVELLDSLLRAEGLKVDHKPVVISSAGGDNVVAVVLYIEHNDSAPDGPARSMIDAAIGTFKRQFPRAQIEVLDPAGVAPVSERSRSSRR